MCSRTFYHSVPLQNYDGVSRLLTTALLVFAPPTPSFLFRNLSIPTYLPPLRFFPSTHTECTPSLYHTVYNAAGLCSRRQLPVQHRWIHPGLLVRIMRCTANKYGFFCVCVCVSVFLPLAISVAVAIVLICRYRSHLPTASLSLPFSNTSRLSSFARPFFSGATHCAPRPRFSSLSLLSAAMPTGLIITWALWSLAGC